MRHVRASLRSTAHGLRNHSNRTRCFMLTACPHLVKSLLCLGAEILPAVSGTVAVFVYDDFDGGIRGEFAKRRLLRFWTVFFKDHVRGPKTFLGALLCKLRLLEWALFLLARPDRFCQGELPHDIARESEQGFGLHRRSNRSRADRVHTSSPLRKPGKKQTKMQAPTHCRAELFFSFCRIPH